MGKAIQDVPAEVMQLRKQQIKNFFTILMVSNGPPMFCAGDEFMNTQHGNNNPWNQDNETSWLDWALLDKNTDIFPLLQGHDRISQGTSITGRAAASWREGK